MVLGIFKSFHTSITLGLDGSKIDWYGIGIFLVLILVQIWSKVGTLCCIHIMWYMYNFNSYQVSKEDLLLMLILSRYTYIPYQHLFSSWYHVGVSSKYVLNEAIFGITTLCFSYITHACYMLRVGIIFFEQIVHVF